MLRTVCAMRERPGELHMSNTTLIIIILVILFAGGGLYGRGRWF
ncbi:hypothetical protein [Variibacter gotjawalensis]|nr:hypothetical protein [Variibacter gotjawalensis]NIK49866.1 hypothetical protein [Variibacter gotjawalensis]